MLSLKIFNNYSELYLELLFNSKKNNFDFNIKNCLISLEQLEENSFYIHTWFSAHHMNVPENIPQYIEDNYGIKINGYKEDGWYNRIHSIDEEQYLFYYLKAQ